MKISFFITDMSQGGGMERVTANLSNQLVSRGYDIKVVSLIQENPNLTYLLDNNVETLGLLKGKYNRQQQMAKRLLTQFLILRKLKNFLKSDSSDLFIAQGLLPALFLWLCGYANKTIVCEHFKYELYTNYFVLKLRLMIYKSMKNVVTLTDEDANKFIRKGIDAKTIPNMVPFKINDEISKGISCSRRILCVGRLENQKGFDLLINAVATIKDRMDGWEIHIYGDGSQKEYLTGLIENNQCGHIIKLMGYSNDIDYDRDAFSVVPSRFEGFSMAILEFMAKGVPVVSFDCPEGPGVLLKGEVGILIPPEDVDKLSNAILSMAENLELREKYAKRGLQRASKYAPDYIMKQWEKLLASE